MPFQYVGVKHETITHTNHAAYTLSFVNKVMLHRLNQGSNFHSSLVSSFQFPFLHQFIKWSQVLCISVWPSSSFIVPNEVINITSQNRRKLIHTRNYTHFFVWVDSKLLTLRLLCFKKLLISHADFTTRGIWNLPTLTELYNQSLHPDYFKKR